ncbi:MAG: trypsin-like serine protease [Beijerinckiaceae bacterium]|nr:trypsin-like serine protease [Beijerinckiaceae bacterium]
MTFASLSHELILADGALAVGGSASAPASEPTLSHAVMVLGSKGSACSGAVVAADIVLTAGHCVAGSKQLAIAYIVNGKPLLEAVADVETHPQFSGFNSRSIDLAMVRLMKPLPSSFSAVLLEKNIETAASYTLAGFGLQTSYDESSAGRLRKASVDSLALTTSRVIHLGREAKPAELQICKGDSGGPVFSDQGGTTVLSGVIVATYNSNVKPGARWSAICGNTAQAIRIGPQREWIESVLNKWR